MNNQTKLKIAVAASEVDPYSKSGGLADVVRALSKSFKRLGHDVVVVSPLYSTINKSELREIFPEQTIKLDKTTQINYSVWRGFLMNNLPVYFIEEKKYLSRYKKFYGTSKDNARFLIFDICALDLLKKLNWQPDIIQCHDWQTGLIPYFLTHRYQKDKFYSNTSSVFTIHNLIFQLGHNWWEVPADKKDNGRGGLPEFKKTKEIENINFAKRAIRNADLINTVSEQYAKEILTKKFGQELHRILKNRQDRVFGIVNGIDYNDWNPTKDPGLTVNYDFDSLHKKTKNKIWLQEQLGLTIDPKIPLVAWTSRLTEQKGIELIMDIIDPLLRLKMQMVILGLGEKKYESYFNKIAKKYPNKFAVRSPYIKTDDSSYKYDNKKETQVLAAADIYLLPSRYEPCGIGQLKSMRYGAIPVVHKVGGLADTVDNYQTRSGRGNGFVFEKYDSRDMLVAIVRALENHKHRNSWLGLVRQAMQKSFSWELPAGKYIELFQTAIKEKNESKLD